MEETDDKDNSEYCPTFWVGRSRLCSSYVWHCFWSRFPSQKRLFHTRSCRRLVWRPSNWSERRFRISRNLRFLEKDIVKLEKDIVTEQPNGKIQEYFVSDAYTKQGCFGSHIENDASWKPYWKWRFVEPTRRKTLHYGVEKIITLIYACGDLVATENDVLFLRTAENCINHTKFLEIRVISLL